MLIIAVSEGAKNILRVGVCQIWGVNYFSIRFWGAVYQSHPVGVGGWDGRHIVAEGRRFGTPPLDVLTHSSLLASEKKSQPNQ